MSLETKTSLTETRPGSVLASPLESDWAWTWTFGVAIQEVKDNGEREISTF